MNNEAQNLINAMDELLAETKAPATVAEFWAQSVSASVLTDYNEGRVVDV